MLLGFVQPNGSELFALQTKYVEISYKMKQIEDANMTPVSQQL